MEAQLALEAGQVEANGESMNLTKWCSWGSISEAGRSSAAIQRFVAKLDPLIVIDLLVVI